MKKILGIIPVLAAAVAALWLGTAGEDPSAATAGAPLYPMDIEVLADGRILIGGRGTRDVRLYDPAGKLLRRWEFTEPVTSLTVGGERLYATSSYARGYVSCIDLASGNIIYKEPTGMGACAATLSDDGDRLWVGNRYKGTVSEVDPATGRTLREVAVLREPCAIVASVDGRYLFVNNFLPAQRADSDYVAADVSVIDLQTFAKIKDIKLGNGSNALRGICRSPDGRFVYVSHNLGRFQVPTSQLQQGWMNTSSVSVIDVQRLELVGSMLLDEPDRGAAGVWSVACDGRTLAVVQSGTHDVSLVDYPALTEKLKHYPDLTALEYDLYFMRGIRRRIPVQGNGPRAMAFRGGKLYVPTFFSDTLNVIDPSTGGVTAIALNPGRLSSREDTGERVFNDASFCYQNWQSCNGCHPGDARTDGMNWDLLNDGIGNPKNCKSMLFSHVTPPCMISGIRAKAELAVRAGFIHIQFSQIDEQLAECVDDYLKSLRPLPSPYLVNGKLSPAAEKGRRIFESLGCDHCHSGVYYTDMKLYRIGEDVEFEAGWDTPTLREVWRTAPYLFDGRAATMRDVFAVHKHGVRAALSDEQIDQLTEYVNSL